MLTECLATKGNDAQFDNHLNLCQVAGNVLARTFPDRPRFQEFFFQNFFDRFLEEFQQSFDSSSDRLYVPLFALTESALKESDTAAPSAVNERILQVAKTLVTLLVENYSEDISHKMRQLSLGSERESRDVQRSSMRSISKANPRTSTFSMEVMKANTKLVKVFEVLRLVYKKFADRKEIVDSFMNEPELPHVVIKCFKSYVQNNILHNQIYKFLAEISETKEEKLFERFFSENAEFIALLNLAESQKDRNYSNSKNASRAGFFGQIKALVPYLIKSPFATKLKNAAEFSAFFSNFYTYERELETKCLGDVDVRPDEGETETYFVFAQEEMRDKYAVFLGFEPDPAGENPNQEDKPGKDPVHASE